MKRPELLDSNDLLQLEMFMESFVDGVADEQFGRMGDEEFEEFKQQLYEKVFTAFYGEYFWEWMAERL